MMKVYKYGLLPPVENAQLIEDQLFLAHKYKNKLIEIELNRRNEVANVFASTLELSQRIADLEEALASHGARRGAKKSKIRPEVFKKPEVIALKAELKPLYAEYKAQKSKISEDSAVRERLHKATKLSEEEIKKAYAESGVYWGTMSVINRAVEAMRKSKTPPKFRRWDGSGTLGVQIQKGMPCEDVFKNDTRVRIDEPPLSAWYGETRGVRRRDSRTHLYMRVQSENAKPIWGKWPIVMHRPFPKGQIKDARVYKTRIGRRFRWDIAFTVDSDHILKRDEGRGAIALDVGWRQTPNGIRVGVWADEQGSFSEILVNPAVSSGLSKSESLRSIRDRACDAMKPAFAAWLKTSNPPEWFAKETETAAHWKASARFSKLYYAWKKQRWEGDGDGFTLLEAWHKQDVHLLDWEANQRVKSIRRRKEDYRIAAANLADRYSTLILEDMDMRQLAIKADNPGEKQRAQRFEASPSELRESFISAFLSRNRKVVFVAAADTTRICHVCSYREENPITKLTHTCAGCAVVWDQDVNACKNMLARERSGAVTKEQVLAATKKGGAWAERKGKKAARENENKIVETLNA